MSVVQGQLLAQFNNSQVIGVVGGKDIKDLSHADSSILAGLDMSKTDTHLGMVNFFEMTGMAKVPFLRDILASKDVIRVNGRQGKFTYDVDLGVEYPTIIQSVDNGEDFLGIAGSKFKIVTSHPFRPGEVLTYDPIDGLQVIVDDEIPVQNTGNGYILTVKMNHPSEKAYFPADKTLPGTRIYKVNHAVSEYGEELGGISGAGIPKKVKLEYQIGAVRGVEVGYTDWANSMTLNGNNASWISNALLDKATSLTGSDKDLNDKFIMMGAKGKNGRVDPRTMKVEKLLPMLALAELYKLNASALMFSHGSVQTGAYGAKRVSEGIYPQLKKGIRLTYNTPLELRNELKNAADYIFSGVAANIDVTQRQLLFKGGKAVYDLVREMFKEEFQLTHSVFMDAQALPVPLVTGKDRNNLTYESYAIGKAFLNGIGNVRIEHDISFDYDFGDIEMRGYTGGKSKRTWSIMIQDITDPKFTNVSNRSLLPQGIEVEEGSMGKNLYLVKPANVEDVSWGMETGRMSGTNVRSMSKHAGETFWCRSQMDAWIPDLNRTILIEKPDALTESFYRF